MWRLLALALGAAAVLAAALPSVGYAAPPPNDAFDSPQVIDPALPSSTAGNNTDATAEPNEPAHGTFVTATSVWFSWTPIVSGHARISVCGDGLKPFAVYTGSSLTSLNEVVATEPEASACIRTFRITSGTTYRIAVDSYFGGNAGPFTLSLRTASPPANDDFIAAQTITGYPTSVTSNNVDATAEPGEPTIIGGGHANRSVWYRWSNPSNRVAYPTADACSLDHTALVGVYVGNSLGSLVPVDELFGSGTCDVRFRADPGTVFSIAVDSEPNSSNDEFTFTLTLNGPLAPANDNIGSAQIVGPQIPLRVKGSNALATDQPGEPDHAGLEPFWSVWYAWTSPSTGPVVAETCFTSIDSVLGVYSGSGLGSLIPVAANDDGEDYCESAGGSWYGSAAHFTAIAGTTYLIAVDAWDDSGPGDFSLAIKATGPHTVPGTTGTPAVKRCPKGKKLKKGKCVKKKPKKRKKRKR